MGQVVNSCALWARSNFIGFHITYDLQLDFKDGFNYSSHSLFIRTQILKSFEDLSFLEKLQVFVRILYFSRFESSFRQRFVITVWNYRRTRHNDQRGQDLQILINIYLF